MATDDTLVRVLLLVVVVVFLVPMLMMALMMPMMSLWGGGHMWNDGMWAGTGIWPWLLTWLVFLLVLFGAGYLLYRAAFRSGDREADPALEELRLAYARGELTDEEFEERRSRLQRELER